MENYRSWMYGEKSTEFVNGVFEFCESALKHQARTGQQGFFCPCVECSNVCMVDSIELLRKHVLLRGFRPQYHIWVYHGEEGIYKGDSCMNNACEHQNETHMDEEMDNDYEHEVEADDVDVDCVEEIMEGVQEDEISKRTFESLMHATKTPLYPGCEEFTQLSVVLKLFNIKAKNNWSDASFTSL